MLRIISLRDIMLLNEEMNQLTKFKEQIDSILEVKLKIIYLNVFNQEGFPKSHTNKYLNLIVFICSVINLLLLSFSLA